MLIDADRREESSDNNSALIKSTVSPSRLKPRSTSIVMGVERIKRNTDNIASSATTCS